MTDQARQAAEIAVPSPALPGEREAFEAWYRRAFPACFATGEIDPFRQAGGQYIDVTVSSMWAAWQARASAPTVATPDEGELEKLIRRLLEIADHWSYERTSKALAKKLRKTVVAWQAARASAPTVATPEGEREASVFSLGVLQAIGTLVAHADYNQQTTCQIALTIPQWQAILAWQAARAATPSPAGWVLVPRDKLLAIAINKHERMAGWSHYVPNGLSCNLCDAESEEGEPLVHKSGCALSESPSTPAVDAGSSLTVEQAEAELVEFRGSKEWTRRYFAGDKEAIAKYDRLVAIVSGALRTGDKQHG